MGSHRLRQGRRAPPAAGHPRPRKTSARRLRTLIEEALVDCYTEDDQHNAFLVMLEDHLACPLKALVVGEAVAVRRFEWEGGPGEIVAVCRRKGRTYRVNATALEWSGRPPAGARWLAAYRAWLRGNV